MIIHLKILAQEIVARRENKLIERHAVVVIKRVNELLEVNALRALSVVAIMLAPTWCRKIPYPLRSSVTMHDANSAASEIPIFIPRPPIGEWQCAASPARNTRPMS